MRRNIKPLIEIEFLNGTVVINDSYISLNLDSVKRIQTCLRVTGTYTVYFEDKSTFLVKRDQVRYIREKA